MRERWPGQFATRIAELDLVTEFEEHGLAYAALDARGEVVVHIPGETDVRDEGTHAPLTSAEARTLELHRVILGEEARKQPRGGARTG